MAPTKAARARFACLARGFASRQVAKCEDRYNKAKAVHRVMRHVAEKHTMVLEALYAMVGWPLYKKYGHCYDAFKLVLTDQEDVFSELPNVDPETKDTLVDYIKKRLAPQPIKVRSDVEVTCFTYEGIDAVRRRRWSRKSWRASGVSGQSTSCWRWSWVRASQ